MSGRLLIIALVVTAPAVAQFAGTYRTYPARSTLRVDREIGQIRDNIDDGRDSGRLSRKQAKALRRDADRIAAIEARTPASLSDAERAQFAARREVLRAQVAAEQIKPGK